VTTSTFRRRPRAAGPPREIPGPKTSRNFSNCVTWVSVHLAERGEEASYLIHDKDTKFTAQFDAILKAEGISIKEPTAKSPNLNAFAERWAQSVQVECLDHFVVLGEDHLRHIVGEYVAYFNTETRNTVTRYSRLLGRHAQALHDELVDFSETVATLQSNSALFRVVVGGGRPSSGDGQELAGRVACPERCGG